MAMAAAGSAASLPLVETSSFAEEFLLDVVAEFCRRAAASSAATSSFAASAIPYSTHLP